MCEHELASHDYLTFCLRCGRWFAAAVDDEGFGYWRPFNREPVTLGASHSA